MKSLRILAAGMALILAGCSLGKGDQPPPPAAPPVEQSKPAAPPVTPPTPPSLAELPPEKMLYTLLAQWGDLNNVAKRATAVEWLALDDDHRVVVGAVNEYAGPGVLLKRALHWFQEERTGRVLARDYWQRPRPDGRDSLVLITRANYDRWPSKTEAPADSWSRHISYAAQWDGPLPMTGLAKQEPQVKHWAAAVMGQRLVSVSLTPEGRPTVRVVAESGSRTDRERLLEATRLGALLFTGTAAELLQVEFRGASAVRIIEVDRPSLQVWAMYHGDTLQVERFMTVDGVQPKPEIGPTPPFRKGQPLADLLTARRTIEQGLPAGARLYLGLMGTSRTNLAVIEAQVGTSESWEQAWERYGSVVDLAFVAAGGLQELILILTRGGEVEYLRFDLPTWALRHYLVRQAGQVLDPAHLPVTAQIYHRYQVVGR